MANINDVEKLYNALKRDGYDDLGTLDEFSSRVSDRDKAKKLYEAMQRDGYDDLGTADDFYGRLNPQSAYKPTADEMAGFQRTIGQAQQTVAGSQQAARRIDARQKHARKTNYGLTPPQVRLGQNSKVVETDPHFNLDTGKMESTYITEQGNEYGSREGADIEQNAVDIAKRQMTLPGQLDDAYAERDRLDGEIAALETKYNSALQENNGFVYRDKSQFTDDDDTRLQTLKAAKRQNEQRIIALEAERDDDGGTQFWRGFLDAAKNPSTWSFGISDLDDMRQLWRIKEKVDAGEELSDDEQDLLKNTMANGYAQQMFGENRGFMYRAGGISMQALPFVAEFMATGGFSALTQMGANAGTRVAEKFALEGLKKSFLRNTGVVMGDIASSFIMANTTGVARTGADIMERNIGQVTMDEDGNYQFEGGKSLGRSIFEGEVASTLEYYTEKLGEHLQLGNWIAKGADKMGLSKLSKAVGYLSNSKMLNAGGIQDYPSEVVEEQANLLLNAILVGDNNFSIDPNSKDFDKSVFNPKTQLDIWGGMMFSIGLMQAPRLVHTGYNAAGYYAYKHTTDVADASAAIVFGADNWQMIKEQIDNCDNEHLSELLQTVIDGDMNDMQKTATLNYAGNLLKMRGYNNGVMADVRGGEDFQSEEGFLSHGIDQGYQQGHEAQEPDEKKMIVDEANAAEQELSHMFSDQDIQWITNTDPMTAIDVMLSNRGTNPGEWNDDEISAVVDYYQKQARAQGVMDAAADDVEYQVAKANAEVDANTHKGLNQMILAESAGEQFYIVGGDVSLIEDVQEGKYTFNAENTGDALIVRNAETGEISVKSPQMLSVNLVSDPNILKTMNETELRQEVTQQHDDEITFGSPAQEVFQLEDTVTLNDGQGNIIEGEIGQMPNAYDGAYVVYTSDGRALQFTGDELNKMIVAHNGMEVERAQPLAAKPQGTVQGETVPELRESAPELTRSVPELTRSVPVESESRPEQPQSALDRIPFLQDESGRPILNRKGKKQYQWHKATVEDTAEALTETTGGDMLMARDTATDLINNARGKLEKIRKQKPKGDDPIEIAESRAEIKRQEQEQQDIIKHWQDVNQLIQQQMREEQEQAVREREAAKSEEQRQREAEEARISQEQQAAIQAERRRKQVEEEVANWNKPYGPLSRARKEMEKDADAVAILNDTEPRSLDEWVSSFLRPQSMMWEDETDPTTGRTVIGLQSELGLQKKDIERIGGLVAPSSKGGKPFGQVVHDIWEDLPEGMKNMYDDQDVRNALIGLFGEGNTMRMRHLTEEHRIEEAREMMKENERRDAEAELDAWAEFYHLTPEERETFEDWLQLPPTEPEQEIINQIIAEHAERQSSGTSPSVGEQPVVGGIQAGVEGGESPVQGTVEAAGNGVNEASAEQNAEAGSGEPAVSDDQVAGGTQGVDREALRVMFDQIEEDVTLADRMSDYEVEQLTAMVDDWDEYNDKYGQVIEEQKDNLKSKNKNVRDAAQAAIDTAQSWANQAFEPIQMYIEELNAKYGIESEKPFEGAIPTPKIDMPRYKAIRQALVDGYARGDKEAIQAAAQQMQAYVDEGLDHEGEHTEIFDIAEEYDGNDPEKLADQYIIRTYWDRYLDDDADKEYIKTGLRADMREIAPSEQLKPVDLRDAVRPESAELGVNEANERAKHVAKVQNDVDELSKKYRSLTPIVVMDSENPTDEQLEDILGRKATAEELDEGREWLRNFKEPAFYSPFSKKTYIFADKIGDRTEESFFHENMHRWLENMENADEIFDAFWNASTSPTSEENKRSMERQYADQPEAIREEYMVNVFGVNMTKGKVGQLLDRLSPEHRKAIEEFLNEIRYDTTAEATARGAVKEEHLAGTEGKGVHSTSGTAEAGERLEPYSSFDELVADTDITVKDNERKAQLKAVVERIMKAGSTNRRISPRGVEYRFVYWAAGLKKAERTLLKPWANNYWVEDYDDAKAKTATWVDEREQAIYFIKYTPMGVRASDIEWIIVGKETLAAKPQGTGQTAAPIGKTSSPEEIAQEEAKVDTNPTDAQKEAGNYQKGHINVDGYDITIENPKGSVRRGTDASGKQWETTMHNTYGYIRGTEGVDGDHIDLYLSDTPTSGKVFVIDQVNPGTGEFDEHKVMYGFASEKEAREAYLANYEEGWQGLGKITEVSREEFQKWVQSSHRKTKPFAEYKSVKKAAAKPQPTTEPQQPAADATGTVANPSGNKLVTDERYEQLKERMKKKLLGQFNMGIDPEILAIGTEMAVYHIEKGARAFAEYAKAMIADLGDAIRPYLKAFYNGARDLPEMGELSQGMDDYAAVQGFDVFNFDKQQPPSPVEKAQQVVSQKKADKEAAEAVQKIQEIAKKGSTRKGAKKPQQVQSPSLFDMFEEETKPAESETKAPETETKPAKQETPAQPQQTELKLRPATEADIDSRNPVYYYQGKRVYIIAVMRSGEQISATEFSKPKIDSIMLTNGKSVKLEDLQVEDKGAKQPAKKGNTAWWNDPNRPKNLDPSDYSTYTTDEAKAYFEKYVGPAGKDGKPFPDFTKWAHPNLAYITAAAWDGAVIPLEELQQVPEIQEAEARRLEDGKNGNLVLTPEEIEQHAQHLLDAEHGSQVYKDGKKVKDDYSGPVRQEHKALIVIGRPAGGKSSVFADRLSYENGARIVDSDVVKPWLEGFDEGYGAGVVHDASAKVAERAMDIAVENGDNMIIPRIGGPSVISKLVIPLREKGYDVQLYFNEVSEQSSIMRAASRFAQEGRYLCLEYLTTIKGKDYKTFRNFAEKNLGEYYAERDSKERPAERIAGTDDVLLERGRADGRGSEGTSRSGAGESVSQVAAGRGQLRLEPSGTQGNEQVADGERIFSYAEWKSNDVAFGEKPKEIWNSKSGEPMPGTVKKNSNEGEQKVSGKPESVGQGAEQASGSTERTGTERSPEQNRAERSGSGYSVENTQGVTDGGEARDSSEGPSRNSKDGVTRGTVPTSHKNRRNNAGERGKDYAPLSPKARFNANVQAIKMMRELIDQGVEAPTKDQMEVLRQYSGWGGLGTFFNDESSAENKILRDLLDEEEYNAATLSIKTAYYTPAYIIDSLWDIAKAMGFKGGNMLEGSAGIGNIIAQMPRDMSRQSYIEAVEIDKISGKILKLLYPDAKVHIQGFQDTVIRNGSVDLAITNVPFAADISVIDKTDKDLSRRFRQLHDFCIAKNIRKLKEGGIGIFITSSGTMDKSTDLRAWITDEGQADVVGAFRLNNETFGGAKVTSDIIVVRKRVNGVKSSSAIDVSKASPLRVGTYEDKFGNEHQTTMVVNDYLMEHPEMMAGEMAFAYEKGDTYRPGSYGLYPVEGKNQEKMLAQFVKGFTEEVAVPQQQTEQEPVKNQLTAEKEGRMLIDGNGRLCVSERGVAVPLALNATKVKGQTKEQCFRDYQDVQKAVDEVLQQQLGDPDDAALKPKLDALNKAFDKFVKRYGNLHKNVSISFLRNDIDFPSFLALENYSESKDINGKVTVTTRKAPLFSQRVLGFKTEPQPKNIKDAVTASIFRSNSIDVSWIAERLGKSEEDVRNEILESRLGFEDPSTGQLEIRYKYLSGNVREKLAIAEAYNKPADDSAGVVAGKYAANVEELRKIIPMDIPAHLIDFSLGSSWIPKEIYTDYLKEVYDLSNVKLAHIEGSWVLEPQYNVRNEKNRAAGVYSKQFRETIYGHQLVLAALNNRPVKVQKQVSEGYGSSKTTRTVTDQAATQACAVRVDEIKDEFKQFAKKKMQDNPELSAQVEKIYNEKFNALVPMQIDDEFLPDIFEGANMNIHLYGHQKRGVMRGLTSPTMLAHEVGTGKSFTLISTAMEMKRLGTAKKPMIVVQNATVAQMTADAKLLYPNARVLSLSEKDRSAEGRRSFYAKIKYNDWDLIIVPQSTFERIPDSPERELQFIQEKIDEKKHVIEAAEQSGMDEREIQRLRKELEKIEQEYGDTYLDNDPANSGGNGRKKKDAKQEAASLEKAKVKAQEQLDRAVDDVQYFDDLGVDALLVDEAHEYKHLGFQTSIGRGIKGIDPSYSKKCAGLYNKTRSVFEKAGWKNVVFATGTPISNTAAEIWTFMKYLMPADVMRANDIYYFDDFVHNFGNISQMLEFATSGKFKENTRFAAYVNKPELIRIWSQVADTVLTREVGAVNEKIPAQEGGKDQDVFLPQSPSLIRIMNAVRKELERFENMTGKEKKENSSIPLTMYGIAKRAAIDPRLVDADAPDEAKSKTNAAVKEIVKDLEATKEYKGTVAVFCDNQNRLGRSGGKGVVEFNIYDDMKAKLIKAGVPESQIAIIKSGMSITAKQKVFDAVNSGDIRVVLGSTQTLGTGVNMQERLHLLIHMDAPDRPMDYTQRNGRIKRQGNLHKTWGKTIRVLRFGVEDSLDVTAYQRLKTKSGFIDSIMDGKGALLNNQVDRTVEEEEEGLFDNPVAVLSGSQYALKKNQAERELRKYQSKRAQWEADQVYVSNALRHNKSTLEYTQSQIAEEEKQLAHIRSLFPNGTVGTITVEGVKIDMSEGDAALGKLTKTIKEKINDPVNATVKKLRENQIYNDEVMDFTIELDGHKVEFKVSVEREAVYENGKMRTVVHKFTTYGSPSLGVDAHMKSAKSVGDHLNDILDEVVSGRDNTDRIDAYKAKIERINRENEQLQQRVGMEFQYDKELEQARKNVEEYTELMKQEMKEKEAKYAAQQEEAGDRGFDLHKAEESEEEDEDVRYSAAEDDLDEEALIIAQAKATDTYMKAPNGKPTNLNERQWVQVRTQAFKDWFGDWENDPENASQVVDENGEPKVMYHSTNLEWVNKGEPFWEFYEDSHFGTKGQALDRMPAKSGVKVYEVFLNIRNAQRRADADQEYLEEKDMTMSEYWEQCARRSKYNGYDGIVYLNEYEDKEHPADSWIAFRPEQVKSADENVGTFDPTNPDIRHREAERFTEGQTFPIHTTYNYSDNVMNTSRGYSTDLMPDVYASRLQLLDGLRRQYPEYWVSMDSDEVRFESWRHALHSGEVAVTQQHTKQAKSHQSYIERKTRNAVNAINEMAQRMGLDVEVLTSNEGLKGKKARSKGWFNPKTGKITLVLPNNANLSDLINTLLHEGVAHYGLRKMFGSSFETFLDNVYNNVSPDTRAIIDATIKRNKWSQHEATEEYLARLAERTDFERASESGWWRKIKEFFSEMLAKVGFNISLSDNDLRYILWRSYENLVHPSRYRDIFEDAKDTAMQAKLQVGKFARERDRLQRTGRTDTSQIAAEYAAESSDADDMGLLYRDDDDDIAKDIYEDFVAKESFKFKENWQDSMASLKAIQKAIAAETGNVATGAEDAYRFENRMHGRAKNMTEKYDYGFYRPMLKAFHEFCKHCHMSIEHGMDYLISKSGLERNVYYAFRDAARAKITDDINEEREDLDKQYAKGRMSEDDYKAKKQELEEREQNGVDDFMQQVRSMYAYQHAKQQYENGDIDYTEYLRIIELVIRDQLMRKKPKRDADGNIVSDNYYDEQLRDYSGLTETFAKDMYDEAQSVKKRAQRTVDPDERKALWHEYDEKMRQAYGVARQVAEDQVFVAEQYGSDPAETHKHTKSLWDAINAATKETLRHSYESGLIDRNNYYKVRDMFDWYIPLRGWEEDKASDVYTYMGRDNVFSPAVKKTWGRTSKAENPLAYIGNIAVSTILSGHRNQLKQHFLNYVMNNPTSLVSISESWYENIGAEGDSPVWVLRTADTAGKAPDEIAQIVNDFNEEMRLKQNEGKAMPVRGRLRLDVHATSGQKAEHVVEVQRAGHTYQLYINGDPKAAQALNGSAARAVSRISDTWLGKKITSINRDMAAFFTSKNPAFVVSNLSRDLNMAGASVAINEGKEYNAQFIANVAKVLRPRLGESSKWVPASKQPTGLMPSLMRKWQNGSLNLHDETERLFGEFMDEGGETGFVNMLSIDSFKERMQKEIREMNGSSLFGAKAKVKECSTRKALRLLGETFEFYNRCAEDATRFIVYMTSRQMGKSLEESIADAKDVTLNFNRKGTGGMGNAEVRDLFIFVNPAIQALANMYRMAAHHPLKFGAVTAAFVAGGALMPVINQWLLQLFGDDDDKQAYWNLPPWVRKNNLVFWIPGTKNFVTIPLAQEFRVFYGVGEMISSAIMDHPVDKWGLEVFSSVADLVPINPTGNGGNLMVDLAPTMVQPLMQVGENVDFTGKPIWRDNQGNKHAPMYSKAYVSTPTWMVKLGEGLNDITGGNEGRKGWVERNAPVWGDYINNPAVWNHLLQGYFGGMYNTIAKTADVITTTASGELPKIYQTPVINRFLNRPVERDNGGALGEEYYSLINERDEVQYEVRTWKRKASEGDADAQRKLDELMQSERYKRAEVISHYDKILKDLKAGERAIKEGAPHSDKDMHDIHASMDMYKAEMLEELAAIGDGKTPLDAAIEKFNSARTFAEKNKLRLRIERLLMEDANGKKVGRNSDVEKAVAYLRGEEVESRKTAEQYLMLATGEDMAADARIRAAKARIKQVTDEYKKMIADGRTDAAAAYREKHANWFAADNIINGQQRGIATNKKLLGKGYDANIMKLIRAQRDRMLKAIDGLE